MSSHSTKLFLILSNCQGNSIWTVLNKVPGFTAEYRCKVYPNYIELNNQDKIDIINDVKIADVILYQYVDSVKGSYRTTELLLNRKENCILLGFPYVRCNWLWPFFLERCLENNNFCIYDYDIIQELQKSMSNSDILDLYKNNKISFHLKERMKKSITLLQEKEKILDIKMSNYILENYQKKRLFFMFNHPTKYLLIHCANQILMLLGKNIQMPETTEIDPYNDFKYWPIPRCVKEELGLEFDENSSYVSYYEELLEKTLPCFKQQWNVYDNIIYTYYSNENKTMYINEQSEK